MGSYALSSIRLEVVKPLLKEKEGDREKQACRDKTNRHPVPPFATDKAMKKHIADEKSCCQNHRANDVHDITFWGAWVEVLKLLEERASSSLRRTNSASSALKRASLAPCLASAIFTKDCA